MAKKSEELIENTVSLPNSKPNLKISRKTKSTPVVEDTIQDTVSVGSISLAQETKTESKQKRTIRINLNKTKNDKKVEETKIENVEKIESKKSNKPKRTIKLNLPKEIVEPERPKITEISINQNSTFFYTPSVFEKFNINVTDEDEIPEEIIETIPEPQEEINEVEEVIIDESEMYDFESNDVFDINSITITPIEDITEEESVENSPVNEENEPEESIDLLDQIDGLDEVIEEIVAEELTLDAIDEEIENEQLENNENIIDESLDASNSDDVLNEKIITEESDEDVEEESEETDITEEDIENFLKDDEDDDYVFEGITKDEPIIEEPVLENSVDTSDENIIEESNIEELELTDDSLLEALLLEDSINDDTSILDESEDSLLLEAINEEVLNEAADNMDILEDIEEQASSKKENIIGKFFDSSIPSMVESGGEYFSKIKKSIFNNMSNVFKKFSYDEAELVKAANAEYDESLNVEVKEQSVSDIVQNFENAIGTEFSLNNIEVQADPVATIATPVIDEALLSPTSDTLEAGLDSLYSSIITPESNTQPESVNIDDELLEEALLNDFSFEDLEDISNEGSEEISEVEEEIIEKQNEPETEEDFDIEDYFGLNDKKEEKIEELVEETVEETIEEETTIEPEADNFNAEEFETAFLNANDDSNATTEELITQVSQNMNPQDLSSLSQLLTTFNQTITTLSDRIASLENGNNNSKSEDDINVDDITLDDLDLSDVDLNSIAVDTGLEFNDNGVEDIEEPSLIDDFEAFKFEDLADEISLEDLEAVTDETENDISDILSKAFSEDNDLIDNEMKKELLSEVLSVENETDNTNISDEDPTSDFFKIIDSLSKTISELEKAPDVAPKALSNLPVATSEDGKAINILINKDDIFSISILNETYEIVADFDGISVLSENIHISTPKHNFFVQVGEKYIEIHNKGSYFSLDTSFEDIEFANAINNVSFAKKNNKIELIIKDAFKLSSVNNKVELSMLNTVVADLAKTTANNITNAIAPEEIDETSVCDSRTLLISEETQKVYLPYTIDEVMKKLNNNPEYQSVEDVVENEYTLPLSTFKMPIISRFKEAYRFMRVKEKSSVYAALDLALELMFNSNLNPAVIRAAKDLKELNVYLDCLYENEIEKFDCFKIIYKVLPKIQ